MYNDVQLINLNEVNNRNEKKENIKMKKIYKLTTNKSNLVRFARIQFLGILLLCAAIVIVAIIIGNNKPVQTITVEKEIKVVDQKAVDAAAQEKFEQYIENYQPEVVEVEKIVEVEKPVTVVETVEVEKPVEKIVEVEKPVYVETVKTVEVVDNEAVQQLATEMAQQMYTAYKEAYIAQVDGEATQAAIDAKTAELQAEYTQLMSEYVAQADAEKVTTLATAMAQQMFEQFKADYAIEYAEAQEVARIANVSTIRVIVILPNGKQQGLDIQGSLHDELTWAMINEAIANDARFVNYKIYSITNKDAVETFVGRNFQSTRVVKLANK